MGILYHSEHVRCPNFGNAESPKIELLEIGDDTTHLAVADSDEILLTLEGSLELILEDFPPQQIPERSIFLLPAGGKVCTNRTGSATVLILRLRGPAQLCNGFSPEQLCHIESRDESFPYSSERPGVLTINHQLCQYTESLISCLKDGVKCCYYFEIKIREFFLMMQWYYPKEELADFFKYVFRRNNSFSGYIRANWNKFRTVSEIAGSLNMSPKQFSNKFVAVFGTTPYKWMKKGRAEMIYRELRNTEKPIKQIADEHGFNTVQQFAKFIKSEYNMTPGQIRTRL